MRQCGECHGEGLDGAEAPALRGVDFLNGWAGRTTDELFEYVRDAMPPGLGRSLGNRVYLNLVAYILDANGARPGDAPLTAETAVPIGDAADIAEARRAAQAGEAPRRRPTRFVNRAVEWPLTPVTDVRVRGGDPASDATPRLRPASRRAVAACGGTAAWCRVSGAAAGRRSAVLSSGPIPLWKSPYSHGVRGNRMFDTHAIARTLTEAGQRHHGCGFGTRPSMAIT